MGEKLNENVSKNIFLIGILIVIVVFIVGYFTIVIYDNKKKTTIQDDFTILNQQISLDEIYNTYLEKYPEQKCEILQNQLVSQLKTSDALYTKLKQYNENAIVSTDNVIKYQYVITNIKLWMQFNKIKEECNPDLRVMLYIYPEIFEDTPKKHELDAKTIVFESKLRKVMAECNYLSLAIPDKSNIEVIDIIMKEYNILDSPSVWINGETYYDIDFSDEFYNEINCRG